MAGEGPGRFFQEPAELPERHRLLEREILRKGYYTAGIPGGTDRKPRKAEIQGNRRPDKIRSQVC